MSKQFLRQVSPELIPRTRHNPVDDQTLAQTKSILDAVRTRGESALREYTQRFNELEEGDPLLLDSAQLKQALEQLPNDQRSLLERTAKRIRSFAEAQLEAISEVQVQIPGGSAGHSIAPVESAGCYAPGGRYPLPSSVLMTAVTAKTAGVKTVWVASPRATQVTLAAAAAAGADAFLPFGGAQAIAALAYGVGEIQACDVIVGPGNRWVTAAKQLVSGTTGIDLPAGPSELLIIADHTADPAFVAADLLAQAEHDPDALPIVVSTNESLYDKICLKLEEQLAGLPTAEIAKTALENGFYVFVSSLDNAVSLANQLAPEHLQLMIEHAENIAPQLNHYGGLFIGSQSAEVLGDYGSGPNHVLPTGGTARFCGGLSVLNFLRVRTWLQITDIPSAAELIKDATDLARLEGLEAHARAAELRNKK